MTASKTKTDPQHDELWTSQEYAEFIGGKFTASAAAQQRYKGDGPPFVRFGRRVRYRRSDVLAWLEANVETQTPGAA